MSRVPLFAMMVVVIAAIGWVDVSTGPHLGMSLFYIVPVAVTAWHVGRAPGLIAASLAAAAWMASDLVEREVDMLAISTWNGFTRLAIFGGAAFVLDLLHRDRARLRELLAAAESSARTDPLTGLANSRAFHERLREEVPRLARRGSSITLAYVDVDNFKRVNDGHGHSVGDVVLTRIADALRSTVRAGDLAARVGGDEFAVALWDTDVAGGRVFQARLERALADIAADFPGTGLGASVGLSRLGEDVSIDDALRAADAAMYEAKATRKAARA